MNVAWAYRPSPRGRLANARLRVREPEPLRRQQRRTGFCAPLTPYGEPRSMTSAFASALSHWFVVFAFAVAAASGFFPTMMNGIHCGPGTALSFFFGDAAFLVSLFDVSSLTFLFVGIFVLVTSWHFVSS